MSVRHLLYQILSGLTVVEETYGDRLIDAGSLGAPWGDPPRFPYLVTKYGEQSAAPVGRVQDCLVDLWSYDVPEDYSASEKGLRGIFDALDRRSGDSILVEGVRYWLIEARFQATSQDLVDDVLRASAKYSTYRLIINT
jgi:hypothetical protein